MSRKRGTGGRLSPAQRGAVVQRVQVDGWSVREAAAAFGLPERRLAGWVAAYRRHGMASLRDSAEIKGPPGLWLGRLRIAAARLVVRLRSRLGGHNAAAPSRGAAPPQHGSRHVRRP